MKTRILCVTTVFCLSAILAFAQNAGLEGTWVTDGAAALEAAKKAGKPTSGLAEGTKIKFKVDAKKGKVSGTIDQLNSDKEYAIEDGKLTDKTFTFKSVEVVPIGNFGNNNRGGGVAATAPVPIPWKGELTDPNTVTLTRVSPTGEPIAGSSLVLHRAAK